jgi:hypothetical protein
MIYAEHDSCRRGSGRISQGLNGIESGGALQRQMNESRGEDGLRGQPKVSTAER